MPGKKDPEYFPLNLNMSGIGIGPFYGNGSPVLHPHHHHHMVVHGKFDGSSSGNNTSLSEFVNLNGMPPENSDEEEDDGSESVSVQGSDLDVDVDVDVDTLVLNIREKLRMGPKFTTNPNFWTEVPNSSPTSVNNTINNDNKPTTTVVNIHPSHHHHSCSSNSNSSRRRRVHPYSHWKHSSSSSTSSSSNNYRNNSSGSIQKQKSNCHHHWWTSKSYNDISRKSKNNSSDTPEDPYQLLQELIQSGSLIKEAVRRLNKKCFTSTNNANANNNSLHTKKFTYRDEDAENSYPHPALPLSAP